MSYLVLARKHRPSTFEQVVGQEHVSRTLAGAIEADRLAHAFCFTGPRGVGKTSVARILAKAVNCQEGPTPRPCGVCVHCREIEEGRSVDVQEIDAASNSRVEDVRELREMIRYRPQAARFRVTILDEVHMLSKAAFNALLKTLEEPPDHALFILATTDVHKVPLTILSRCQRYDFRRLAPRILAVHLADVLSAEGLSLPPESLALISREADGSVRDSLSLLDQVISSGRQGMTHQEVVELLGLVDRELVGETARAVLAGDSAQVLDLVGRVYAAGGEMQAFYGGLLEHFRNLTAAKAAPKGADLFGLTPEEVAQFQEEGRRVSPETLHEIFHHLASAEEMFRRAGHPRLVMEMTLLKLTQVRPVLSLEEILESLAQGSGPGSGEEPGRPARPFRDESPAPPPGGAASSRPAPGPARVRDAPQGAPPRPVSPAAPAPPAPAPPEGPSPSPRRKGGDPGRALAELAAYLGRSQPLLASYVGRGKARMTGEELEIVLPASPMARDYCNPECEAGLSRAAAELWGRERPVRLVMEEAPREPEDNGRNEEARLAAVNELMNHPAVQTALEVFEAQVVALNPASGKDKTS